MKKRTAAAVAAAGASYATVQCSVVRTERQPMSVTGPCPSCTDSQAITTHAITIDVPAGRRLAVACSDRLGKGSVVHGARTA